jgi:spermidine synthase
VVAGWLLCFASSGLRARILASTAALGMAGLWFFAAPWNQLALTSGEHVYFRPFQVFPGTKLLFFQEDTSGGMTTVVRNLAGSRDKPKPYLTLLTNGKFQGNDSEEVDAQTGFALIPMLHAHAFDTACVIGLGTGRTAQAVNAMGFSSIHIAEIAPGIPQAARGFFTPINHHVLDQPNVSLFLEDGRNLLLLHPERRYDLIAMEITSVWFAGSTSLYCREFFELTRSRLRPGGIFQQWIQLHHIGPFELGSVLATVRSVYPQVEFWVFGGQGILVASESPITLNPAALARFSARAGQGLEIPPGSEQAYLKTLLESRLLAAEDVSRMVRALPLVINTDRNRYLEFTTPRYNLSPLPHLKLNVSLLGRFATFPPFQFAAGSLRDTEDAQKWVAGADPRRAFQRLLDPGATGARP